MVLIITSFGATKNYPDSIMMQKTLIAFLESLNRQTDKDFEVFISCHDIPKLKWDYSRFVRWCSVSPSDEETFIPKKYSVSLLDIIEYDSAPYGDRMTDMSRKTYNSAICAGKYAYQRNIDKFWMLRMDSDDMLARDMIERLNALDTDKVKAVYNRNCHIFDVRSKGIGEQRLPYSSTCNALYMEIKDNELPNWYYHCNDHTKFANMVHADKIPCEEWDWTLCISTNSGNHISNRASIDSYENTKKITLTEELIDRYGLESLL